MALHPVDEVHALQIQAGTLGRRAGHEFEDAITLGVNALRYPLRTEVAAGTHVFVGDPASLLIQYIAARNGSGIVRRARALSTGALATSEDGRRWLSVNGANVSRCKSDLVVTATLEDNKELTVGVSTKQCNNPTPTNAQLYFTTARGFSALLQNNGIPVAAASIDALRRFCGDVGFRPSDFPDLLNGRLVDPRRFFWEEIGPERAQWERILSAHQSDVTRLLLQKAYLEDSLVPEFLLHKTRRTASWSETELALYGIEELIALSARYQGFATRAYSVRKGSFRDPPGIEHLAPRFGVVQMQRGGPEATS